MAIGGKPSLSNIYLQANLLALARSPFNRTQSTTRATLYYATYTLNRVVGVCILFLRSCGVTNSAPKRLAFMIGCSPTHCITTLTAYVIGLGRLQAQPVHVT